MTLQFRAGVVNSGWQSTKIGGGGWVTGLDIAADGTKVCRTDVGGAYYYNASSGRWVQLFRSDTMSSSDYYIAAIYGCYAIAIAPSDTNIFYAVYGNYVYKTTNRGASMVRTNFSTVEMPSGSDASVRAWDGHMAVNPSDANHVVLCTPSNGTFQTFNGGTSWSAIGDIPAATYTESGYPAGGQAIFVSSSEIIVCSPGNGMYRSTNTGTSFSAMTGDPTQISNWDKKPNGEVWACAVPTTGTNLWKCVSGTWTNVTSGGPSACWSVACDPNDNNKLFTFSAGLINSFSSTDGGTTWVGPYGTHALTASDIPWLASSVNGDTYFAQGNTKFDKTNGRIYAGEGIGVFYCTHPTSAATVTWTSQTLGIEELPVNKILSPIGGSYTLIGGWDRPIFTLTDQTNYPSNYGPNHDNQIIMCWDMAVSPLNPNHIVAIVNWSAVDESCYSTDGGLTWTEFATKPAKVPPNAAAKKGGCIACCSIDKIVWVPSNNADPYYTLDRGATWTKLSLSGVPAAVDDGSVITGWGQAYYYSRFIVTVDTSVSDTYYMFNHLDAGDGGGVWKSTDAGVNWTRVYAGQFSTTTGAGSYFECAPGKTGHLWYATGNVGTADQANPSGVAFWRSTDGGVSWDYLSHGAYSTSPVVNEVHCFGFGATKSGASYPTLWMVGWISNVYGIYRSIDAGVTFTKVGDFPMGLLGPLASIRGDGNNWNKCYVSIVGQGAATFTA